MNDCEIEQQEIPRCLDLCEAKLVACGGEHSMIFTSKGLYVFGKNSCGQLGLGHLENCPKPTLIKEKFTDIKLMACGQNFSLVNFFTL